MKRSERAAVIEPGRAAQTRSRQPATNRGRTQKPRSDGPAKAEHLLEEHAGESEVRAVRLSLFQPDAREVFVAGTFSNWQASAIPLAREADGTWFAELRLNPGTYEYRFIVDGRWIDDPMAPRYVANPFGETNCVLEVKSVA